MAVGPYEQIGLIGGGSAPFYLLRYDGDGRPNSPRTEAHLRAAASPATDIFIFAHGWNNVFADAVHHYRDFLTGYLKMRADFDLPAPAGYRPLLIGVIWPSTSFVDPSQQGPAIAADTGGAETEELLRFVTESLEPAAAAELSELVDGADRLSEAEAGRALEILRSAYAMDGDGDGVGEAPTVAMLLDACARLGDPATGAASAAPADFGTAAGVAAPVGGGPQAAGLFNFGPKDVLRVGTVWKMKARAGAVGANGVGPLLRHLLSQTGARVHLIGHSFGARVLLSALAAEPVGRPATSMLLLQAAVNRWCFAADAAGTGRAGGYRPVLSRVERPVVATTTRHDHPLRLVFHLALRGGHLGEPQIAAIGDEERYGALGGYGPAGLGGAAATVAVKDPGSRYELPAGVGVLAVDGSRTIGGHGDVSNPSTWWMLHTLTRS